MEKRERWRKEPELPDVRTTTQSDAGGLFAVHDGRDR
jgi:hypothetical protein